MKTTYMITAGKVPSSPSDEGDLMSFTLGSLEDVKDAAMTFITVIPDDLEDYRKDITDWDGSDRFTVSHQDDDYFIFVAQPMSAVGLPSEFTSFVDDYKVDDHDEDTAED